MSDVRLDVYLFFKGECREAMEFYKSVFGGELDAMSYADTPGDMPLPEGVESKDWLMHASLTGGEIKLMASDTGMASAASAKVDLSLGGADEARMREIFDKLSEGGTVTSPLKKEFWGDTFGAFTDKFGVNWMMNIGSSQEK
jgi:PhnB protein